MSFLKMILSYFVMPKLADCLPETKGAKKQQIINFPVLRGCIYTATKRPH